jgi:hypothetical protein
MTHIPDKLQIKFFSFMAERDTDSLDWTGNCVRNAEQFIKEHNLTNVDPIDCVGQYILWINNLASGYGCEER